MNGLIMRSRKKSKSFWKQKRTHNSPKLMVHREGSSVREVHSDTGLPKENRKISNQQPNLTSKITRGTTNKAQSK